MKKTVLAVLFISLLSLGYYFNVSSTPKKVQTNSKQTEKINHPTTQVSPPPIIEEQIKQTHPQSNFNMEETGQETVGEAVGETIIDVSVEHKVIFEEESVDDMKERIEHMPDVLPVGAIRMQQGMLANLQVGDSIQLPSIDGTSYALQITNRSVSDTGNVSVDGSYMENEVTYRSILTEGKHSAFISMSTPTGTYEVELHDGIGYIYAVADIENAKIDFTKSDVMEVPHNHDEHHDEQEIPSEHLQD